MGIGGILLNHNNKFIVCMSRHFAQNIQVSSITVPHRFCDAQDYCIRLLNRNKSPRTILAGPGHTSLKVIPFLIGINIVIFCFTRQLPNFHL